MLLYEGVGQKKCFYVFVQLRLNICIVFCRSCIFLTGCWLVLFSGAQHGVYTVWWLERLHVMLVLVWHCAAL